MNMPNLRRVPIDMDDETRRFLESLKDYSIDVARVEGDNLFVLGCRYRRWARWYSEIIQNKVSGKISETSFKDPFDAFFLKIFTIGIYSLIPAMKKRRQAKQDYDRRVGQYEEANLKDAYDKIKDIRLYQGTIDELQNELGRPIERVETSKPETFIQQDNTLWLRVHAYLLGANAIVHYQPGSSIGTPVKYSDKTE